MSVSMDFITQFPQVQEYNEIMVIVDHFCNYVVFILMKMSCGAEKSSKML